MNKYEEKIEEIKEYLEDLYNPDFDFNVDHWEWGNIDDSYSYGMEAGEQHLIKELLNILKDKYEY